MSFIYIFFNDGLLQYTTVNVMSKVNIQFHSQLAFQNAKNNHITENVKYTLPMLEMTETPLKTECRSIIQPQS